MQIWQPAIVVSRKIYFGWSEINVIQDNDNIIGVNSTEDGYMLSSWLLLYW
jgi:hypothetical protein